MFILASRIFENIVTDEEIEFFLSHYDYSLTEVNNKRTPYRIDRYSDLDLKKYFGYSSLEKSKYYESLQSILNKVLDEPYTVELVMFYENKNYLELHVDTGDTHLHQLYKNVLIPLDWEEGAATIVFKNRWNGKKTFFHKSENFSQSNWLNDNARPHIPDNSSKNSVHPLLINQTYGVSREKYYTEIKKETETNTRTVTPISLVENFDPNLKFDQEIHKKYFSNQEIGEYDGLTVQEIFDWTKGSVLTFDRQHVHTGAQSGDYSVTSRRAIIIHTNRKI